MTEQRPTLARKHTRGSEDKRKSALDEGIRLDVDGTVYEVRVGDLTAVHERKLRREYGATFSQLMEEFSSAPGMDSLAAIVWLARVMKGERDLMYDEVAEVVGVEFAESLVVSQPSAVDADAGE